MCREGWLLLKLLQFVENGQTRWESCGRWQDGLPFVPIHRHLDHHQPPASMADVQTNLLSYILTKLHSDVARIESLIHQVHTGRYPLCRFFLFFCFLRTLSLINKFTLRRRIPPPSTPNIRRRCPTYPLKGAPANPRRPRPCAPRGPHPASLISPPNHPPDPHPQREYPTRCVSPRAAATATSIPPGPGSERRSRSEARSASASEESTGPGVVGLQYRW